MVTCYRFVQLLGRQPAFLRFLCLPIFALYEFVIIWVMKIEIRFPTRIGEGLSLVGCGVAVVHEYSIIGENCSIGNCVTVGAKPGIFDCPTIGDNVVIGSHSVVLGRIRIGNRAVICPGSVVTKDVKDLETVSGNPARPIAETA